MSIKGKLKTLAAALLAVAGTLAPFGAWATPWYEMRHCNPIEGPLGVIVHWECSYIVPNDVGTVSTPVQDGPFDIYRDGVLIATVTDTTYYTDYEAEGGKSYSYVVSGHGVSTTPRIAQSRGSYHLLTDLIDTGVEKTETNRSFRASVQKRYITNLWTTSGGSILAGDHLVTNLVSFTATSDSEWLTISDADQNGKATYNNTANDIAFTVAPNMTDQVRTAVISIRPADDNWLVLTNMTFTQAAGPAGFAVNFETCGGTGDTSMRVRQEGDKLGSLPVVTLSGSVFLGWFTAAEGGEVVTEDTVVTGDATYYAHWVSLGELQSYADASGVVWKYQVLNGGTETHPVLYAKIIGDGSYPVSNGSIVETGAIDKSTAGKLTIPSSLGGYPVRVIGQWAFAYCRNLTNVTIPDSVETIEDCAFASCSGMESVHLGANVATIGGGAFLYCTSLKMLTLPESVDSLGASAFGGCESLEHLCVESDFSSRCHIAIGQWIGGMMFNLVGGGIDMDPLWDCTALSSIELGKNVKSVYLDGFGKGPNLRSVICRGMLPTISGGNTSYGRTTCYVLRENYPDGLPAETWAGMELRYLDGEGPTSYAVTFNANGGTSSPATRQVASGSAVGTLPTPTRSGYTFTGWFTAAVGGTQISASTKVTANVTYYAHWTANGGGDNPPSGGSRSVTVVIGGTETTVKVMDGDAWGASLPKAETIPSKSFVGWFTGRNGTGTRVTSSTIVSAATKVLYAYYVDEDDHCLYDSVVGAVSGTAAATYDGYVCDASGNVKGTIQVKVGKPNAKTGLAAVKATVIGLDGKKKTLKAAEKGKAKIVADGPTTVALAGGEVCEVILGAKGMGGKYGNYTIDGALNVFTSKIAADKATASAVLGKWQGAVNVAWRLAGDGSPYQTLSVTIAAKGKAKVSGTLANGAKVSAKGQLIVGEEWCCVPVVVSKKAQMAFNVWLPLDATSAAAPAVVGLADAVVGKPGALKGGAKFYLDAAIGDAKYDAYLPDGLAVGGGAKWTLPKAGKVQLAKDGTVDAAKLGENPSALKLTYKAKDGSFKGTFKAYADVNGRPKGTTVKVTGVLVNGIGYGTASVKGAASVPVTIE